MNWAIHQTGRLVRWKKKPQELIDWIFHFAVNYFRVNFLWSLMLVPSLIFSSVLYMPVIGYHRELALGVSPSSSIYIRITRTLMTHVRGYVFSPSIHSKLIKRNAHMMICHDVYIYVITDRGQIITQRTRRICNRSRYFDLPCRVDCSRHVMWIETLLETSTGELQCILSISPCIQPHEKTP